MGNVGALPSIADYFHVSISKAGLLVSLLALAVAISGPTMPLLFSGINGKKALLLVLGVFVLGNIVPIFASNFTIVLIARVIPAFFHPVYVSITLTAAAASVLDYFYRSRNSFPNSCLYFSLLVSTRSINSFQVLSITIFYLHHKHSALLLTGSGHKEVPNCNTIRH